MDGKQVFSMVTEESSDQLHVHTDLGTGMYVLEIASRIGTFSRQKLMID
jgi:hypothetical protein